MLCACRIVNWHISSSGSIDRTSDIPIAFEGNNAREEDEINAMAEEVTAAKRRELAASNLSQRETGSRDHLVFKALFTSCERGSYGAV